MTEDLREPADVKDEPPGDRAPAQAAGDDDGSPRARPSEESQRDDQEEEEALAPLARDISDLVE